MVRAPGVPAMPADGSAHSQHWLGGNGGIGAPASAAMEPIRSRGASTSPRSESNGSISSATGSGANSGNTGASAGGNPGSTGGGARDGGNSGGSAGSTAR